LQTFVAYFSAWDRMVSALDKRDSGWIEANVPESTLSTYRAHAIWAYCADEKLLFTRNLLYSEKINHVPLQAAALHQVLQDGKSCHFFAETPHGLMEIAGGAVHPSADASRLTPSRGYLFAGRLWARTDVEEMSLFTGDRIELAEVGKPLPPLAQTSVATVSFSRVLPGWDGQPLAFLQVRNDSPAVEQLYRSNVRLSYGLAAFALALLVVLALSLMRWVSAPLKSLSLALRSQDAARLKVLQPKGNEFGDLARMMGEFFDQRQKLVREIAERRQAESALEESEERLRHSQKMDAIGRLAGGVAHDFNNLLTAIIGYAQMIEARRPDATTADEAGIIRKAGEQAADLTRQLLAFSRKQILHPRVIDLNHLAREMQKLLRRVIGEKIELRFEACEGAARVNADPAQIEAVLLNLCVNARDAMPRGGLLTMRTEFTEVAVPFQHSTGTLPPGHYVTFTVQDTGCGMDEATQARIFEPFFTTKGPGKGTGLGLATVYGIVRQSGGAIVVQSQPGVGSTFAVHLPRAEAPIAAPAPAPAPIVRPAAGVTVLVVDDEAFVRDYTASVLAANGYRVLSAHCGEEALRQVRELKAPVALLVTDVVMPQMTGPEVARALTAEQPQAKVLFVSGYSEDEMVEEIVGSPEVQVLEKPFTPEALLRKVQEVLSVGGT
jgi:signal transduction histidine kinase/CheY-like chemotaxis protein